MSRIAFIGLGRMGAGMARNLVRAGHLVTGYDLSRECRAALVADGGRGAQSIADAVGDAEVIVTMLPAGKHVESVYTGEGGVIESAASGAVLSDCSTIDIETARRVSGAAAAAGLSMVDAPVSGGVAAAGAGTLTFMVGGEAEAFDRVVAVLEAMGRTVIHAGPAGAGQAAKVCNNMLLAVSMLGTCEAFNLADAAGLDRAKLFEIVSAASGQCWSLTSYCPVPGPVPSSPANSDYQPGFMAALMLKDLDLSQEAAKSLAVKTPMGQRARDLYAAFDAAGCGQKDFSGIIEHLREAD